MKNLLHWLRSYPMRYEREGFRDIVSGDMVNHYVDRHGRKWLANGRWSTFRVKRKDEETGQGAGGVPPSTGD